LLQSENADSRFICELFSKIGNFDEEIMFSPDEPFSRAEVTFPIFCYYIILGNKCIVPDLKLPLFHYVHFISPVKMVYIAQHVLRLEVPVP
jgi:hypothetical protein